MPKPPPIPHATFTSEFHQEFSAHTIALLRRRFLWFTGVMAALALAVLLMMALRPARGGEVLAPPRGGQPQVLPAPAAPPAAAPITDAPPDAAQPSGPSGPTADDTPRPKRPPPGSRLVREITRELTPAAPTPWDVIITSLRFVSFFVMFMVAARVRLRDATVQRLTYATLMIDGVLLIGARLLDATGGIGIAAVTLTHLLACCFLPWTPRQAMLAMAPLLALDAAVVSLLPETIWWKVFSIVFSPLLAVPGTLICWARHTRRLASYKVRFLESRLGSLRQELVAARKVHEALFPRPEARGYIRFDYRYVPMRLIGGDYLHARFMPPVADDHAHPFNLVLLDVTGHGIPAALTVNRLYGELERLHAEDPGIGPGELLRKLNRYIYLTLSNHALFVTALAMRIDPVGNTVEFANAGHPPAFILGADGSLDQLDSTTCVLGVFKDSEFDAAPQSRRFGPGDALIAYTDGAMETKNAAGRMLGVDGMRRALLSARPDQSLAAALMQAVDAWRHGAVADDTLIVEVFRDLTPQFAVRGPASVIARQSGIFTVQSAAPKPTDAAGAPAASGVVARR